MGGGGGTGHAAAASSLLITATRIGRMQIEYPLRSMIAAGSAFTLLAMHGPAAWAMGMSLRCMMTDD
eukprot:COSAG01_NODE_2845_length_6987_cov_19.830139_4_plen_67_part_00